MKRLIRSGGGLVAVALVLLVPAAAWAQSSVTTGQVFGTAKDPNGAVMPGVTIQAKNVDTGFSRNAVTDTSGYYRIDQLPSGTYDVTSMLDGFKTEVKRGVAVTLGSSVQVNFALAITSVQEEMGLRGARTLARVARPDVNTSHCGRTAPTVIGRTGTIAALAVR